MRTGDRVIQYWRMRVSARWVPKNGRILDIGCHQGEFLKYLGNRIAPSVGIDTLLRQNNQSAPHRLLPLVFEEPLPFGENSFDAVVLLATLEHMQDKPALARETWRMLKPKGRVIITVPSPKVDDILSVLVKFRLVDGMSLEEHHGFIPKDVPMIFEEMGFALKLRKKFQFGLNNLFVFEKSGELSKAR